ncbi:hypothetical protein DIPPA_28669 [Diplonema papillatum]|nr:hypothetical protein DIPPA_28669 [Diplonema papillatum]
MGVEDKNALQPYSSLVDSHPSAEPDAEEPEVCRYPPVQPAQYAPAQYAPAQYAPGQPSFAVGNQPMQVVITNAQNPNLQRALFPCVLFTAFMAFLVLLIGWIGFMTISAPDDGKEIEGSNVAVSSALSWVTPILFIVGTVALCFLFQHGTPVDRQRCRCVSIAMLVVSLLQGFMLLILHAKNQSKEDKWDREYARNGREPVDVNPYTVIFIVAIIWTVLMTIACCIAWGITLCCAVQKKETVTTTTTNGGNVVVVVSH